MKIPQKPDELGQSLWLDNITRELLKSGTLKRYMDELSVTRLISNPTIYDHAIKNSAAYDVAIRELAHAGVSVNDLATRLQREGAKAFVKSWNDLIAVVASKIDALRQNA